MTDPTPCPNCGNAVPAGAAFCTNCGHRIEAAPAAPAAPATPAAPDFGADPTRVDTPVGDSTQVLPESAPPPPAAPPSDAPWATPPAAPASDAPWATPPAPAAEPPAWGQPSAPATPSAPAAGAWGQPEAPSAPGAWQPPAADTTWGATAAPQAPATNQWGQTTTGASSSGGGSPLGGIVVLVGGVLTALGLFLAWLSPKGGGDSLSGWELATKKASENPFKTSDPYLLLAMGIVGIVLGALILAKKANGPIKLLPIVVGLVTVVAAIRDYLDIKDIVKKNFPSTVTINFGIGFWLTVVGGVVLIMGAVVAQVTSKSSS